MRPSGNNGDHRIELRLIDAGTEICLGFAVLGQQAVRVGSPVIAPGQLAGVPCRELVAERFQSLGRFVDDVTVVGIVSVLIAERASRPPPDAVAVAGLLRRGTFVARTLPSNLVIRLRQL